MKYHRRTANERREIEQEHCLEARLSLEMETHPNIVAMHYCVVAESEFLMFQDLVDGAKTLSQKIKSKSIYDAPLREVRVQIIGLIKDIAEALRHLHSVGIMHQDVSEIPRDVVRTIRLLLLFTTAHRTAAPQVKSENVLVGSNGSALLADFGLARRGLGSGATLSVPFAGYTPGYDSPELRNLVTKQHPPDGGRVTPPSHDMWAWAVTVMEVLRVRTVGGPPERLRQELQSQQPPVESNWTQAEVKEWAEERCPFGSTAAARKSIDTLADRDGTGLIELNVMRVKDALGLKIAAHANNMRIHLLSPVQPLHQLLERIFSESASDRPSSMDEVLSVLYMCGGKDTQGQHKVIALACTTNMITCQSS